MGKKYLKFILPSTLSFLLTGIYSIVDGIFVGRAMGDDGLAAINIAWPLVALIIALGTGIGMGASVMVSLNLGAGNEKAADKMEGNAFFFSLSARFFSQPFCIWQDAPCLPFSAQRASFTATPLPIFPICFSEASYRFSQAEAFP